MIDLRIANGFCKIYLLQCITKLERSCFRIDLITTSGFKCIVISLLWFFSAFRKFLQGFVFGFPVLFLE